MANPTLLRIPVPLYPALLLLALLFASACSNAPEGPVPPEDPAARDAVLARLDSLHDGTFRDAFAALARTPHVRLVTAEQLGADEAVIARSTYRIRQAADGTASIVDADSSGQYEFGTFAALADDRANPAELRDPVDLVVPEDPAYASPRNAEFYRYELLPDTTLGGRTVERFAVRALPGSDQSIVRARYLFDASTDELVGIELWRVNPSPLFDEESHLRLGLRPGEAGGWRPGELAVTTRVALPWQDGRRFRMVTQYLDET